MIGTERTGGKNVLALPIQVLMGGGLCSFSRVNRYGEYLISFYPKQNYLKRMTNRRNLFLEISKGGVLYEYGFANMGRRLI